MAKLGRSVVAGAGAQIVAQALTGWSLVAHVFGWPEVSIWVAAPLVAAILVPFKHDGSLRDRAAGNFGAAIIVGGLMWWELMSGGLDGLLGGQGFTLAPIAMLMLTATVLFALAGAIFWLRRERG